MIKLPSGSASSLETTIKLHGNHNENEANQIINAGQLTMLYERGNLRHISIGNQEVLRMIYPSVRAKEWLTIDPLITDEDFGIHSKSFIINYTAIYKSVEIDFILKCKIEGREDSSLIFSIDGEALSSFEKNRIGLCILHPVEECAGKTCIVTHSNNLSEILRFPPLVSPNRPFSDIKSMKWDIAGHDCNLEFFGDIFETEDQRNWTDASYKTYSTPINIPYPVRILKGDKIGQKVELKVGGISNLTSKKTEHTEITLKPEKKSAVPKIGIGRSSRTESLSDNEIQILRNLRFDHYRVDLHLFDEWKTKAEISVREAVSLDYPLELALFVDSDFQNQICNFAEWTNQKIINIVAIVIFHKDIAATPLNVIESAGPVIMRALPGVKIIAGTNANFAQLNKARPVSPYMDYTSYSIHPQEHASDNLTLVENLQGQSYTVDSAKKFPGGKEIWISPVNIQRRFNANSGYYEKPYKGQAYPPQVDNRMMSLFGAGWTVGSLKYLIESDVKGITFYETVGERGIMEGDYPSRWPEHFPAIEGMLFPVWFVFRFLLQYKSFEIIGSESSNPLVANCLVFSDGHSYKMLLANFTSSVQKVKMNIPAKTLSIRELNEYTFGDAAEDLNWLKNSSVKSYKPVSIVHINPYSVSFID
jgi:hypothetical protein